MKIKWHRFLTWFALWLGAIMNAITGISMLLLGVGMMGDGGSALLIGFFVSAIGLIGCGLAIFTIKTAIELIKWQWWGVAHLHTLYVISLVMNIISMIFSMITKSFSISSVISLIFSIVILSLTTKYYDKRYQLFDTTKEERRRLLGKRGK